MTRTRSRRSRGRPERLSEHLAAPAPGRSAESLRLGGLPAIVAHARRIQTLDDALARWLDEPLKTHCRVANLDEEQIVLQVDSPVWSQRIRFLLPEVGQHLNADLAARAAAAAAPPPRAVRVRVGVPPSPLPAPPVRGPEPPSPDAARLLRDVAARAGPRLRDALLRLASRAEQPRGV